MAHSGRFFDLAWGKFSFGKVRALPPPASSIFLQEVGLHWLMWLHAAVDLAAGLFVFLVLPETKGKTLAELCALFVKKKKGKEEKEEEEMKEKEKEEMKEKGKEEKGKEEKEKEKEEKEEEEKEEEEEEEKKKKKKKKATTTTTWL